MKDGTVSTLNDDDKKETKQIWKDLVRWVEGEGNDNDSSGGYVHASLTLEGNGPSRGVLATAPIQKGELLINITSRHVLSGTDGGDATMQASPWLRCVGAFLRAKQGSQGALPNSKNDPQGYEPYLKSLPSFEEYETLQKWSDDDARFLKGTTLGRMLRLDRETKGVQTQYRNSVEPYLRRIGITTETYSANDKNNDKNNEDNPQTDALYQSFLEASSCISTRGFHLLPTTTTTSSDTKDTPTPTNTSYGGPFLLPVIDLLNHDPSKACTTLRRHEASDMKTSCFRMVAERDIAQGEEIFHSYGTDLTSAQLLQTFGFVPRNHSSSSSLSNTPVGLRKLDHFLAAAKCVKKSSFPDSIMRLIQEWIHKTKVGQSEEYSDDESADYFWEVQNIPDRALEDTNRKEVPTPVAISMDDEFLISMPLNTTTRNCDKHSDLFLLTEELITLMVAQFLPEEAFDELFSTTDATMIRLDRSILTEDYYLGMLVCKALLVAIALKLDDYCNINDGTITRFSEELSGDPKKSLSGSTTTQVGSQLLSVLQQEISIINHLLESDFSLSTIQIERELYGRTIRVEELKNLSALCKEIESLVSNLSLGDDSDTEVNDHLLLPSTPNKRPKME